jgi:hypothetical protein
MTPRHAAFMIWRGRVAICGLAVIAGCNEPGGVAADASESGTGTRTGGDAAPPPHDPHGEADSGARIVFPPPSSAPLKACRVMASEGGPNPNADATTWLDVPAKASFTVRTLETGRELRVEGPGRVRPCGDDVALVASGSAVGLPGSGEAPGAEQWAATVCGAARWASGVHRLTGGRDACNMQSSLGAAHLWVPEDVTVDDVAFPVDGGAPSDAGPGTAASGGPARDAGPETAWRRIDAKRALRLHGRGPFDTPAAVKLALVACERAAKDVQDLAARMTSPEGGAPVTDIGDLAATSVAARGLARAACSVAAVRIAIGGGKTDDQARLDAATARWRSPR